MVPLLAWRHPSTVGQHVHNETRERKEGNWGVFLAYVFSTFITFAIRTFYLHLRIASLQKKKE